MIFLYEMIFTRPYWEDRPESLKNTPVLAINVFEDILHVVSQTIPGSHEAGMPALTHDDCDW